MALATKSIFGQLASTALTDVYTVPTGKQAIIKLINLVNTSTSATVTVNVYLKKGGTTVRLWTTDYEMQAKERSYDPQSTISLEAGDKIQIQASASGQVDYTITGAEG